MSDASADVGADQVAYWNGAAGERWANLQPRIDAAFASLTEAALDFAAPRIGSAVLDIGCGAGETVLALAKLVGPSGQVTGVDVSKPMLDVARNRLASEGIGHARVLLSNAETEPLEPRRFDLAFSRFGVMFFADPVAAFVNIRSALVENGRLAFACWQPMSVNPWFAVPIDAVQSLLPPSPPTDPLAPGPFAFADPDRVRNVLGSAGFHSIAIKPFLTGIRFGDLSAAVSFLTQIGPASRAISEAEPDRRPALIERLRSVLASHHGAHGIVLDGAIWLVAAQA